MIFNNTALVKGKNMINPSSSLLNISLVSLLLLTACGGNDTGSTINNDNNGNTTNNNEGGSSSGAYNTIDSSHLSTLYYIEEYIRKDFERIAETRAASEVLGTLYALQQIEETDETRDKNCEVGTIEITKSFTGTIETFSGAAKLTDFYGIRSLSDSEDSFCKKPLNERFADSYRHGEMNATQLFTGGIGVLKESAIYGNYPSQDMSKPYFRLDRYIDAFYGEVELNFNGYGVKDIKAPYFELYQALHYDDTDDVLEGNFNRDKFRKSEKASHLTVKNYQIARTGSNDYTGNYTREFFHSDSSTPSNEVTSKFLDDKGRAFEKVTLEISNIKMKNIRRWVNGRVDYKISVLRSTASGSSQKPISGYIQYNGSSKAIYYYEDGVTKTHFREGTTQ
jgi:hypothetical protein